MSLFTPASVPWLVMHELRLMLRGWIRRPKLTIILGVFAVIFMTTFVGLPVAYGLKDISDLETPMILLSIDLMLAVQFTLLLSQTLAAVTLTFYERGDLDLLLSSPISATRVLTVRTLVVAAAPFLFWSFIATPVVIPLLGLGHWPLLAVYPVIGALALIAAALGLLLAMALFALLGARRTRTASQLVGAVIAAGLFVGIQSRNLFPEARAAFITDLDKAAASPLFSADSPVTWPALAVLGSPIPLAIFALMASFVFVGVVRLVGTRFAGDAALAAGADFTPRKTRRRATPLGAFKDGVFVAIVRKEVRLLARDPILLSQILLRILYLLPLTFILLRNAQANLPVAVAMGSGVLTLIAGQLAASFAWTTISGEDAPDLIACAPVDGGFARRAKLTAAVLPVACLLVVPVLGLMFLSPWGALVLTLGAGFASAGTALLNLWNEKPEPRKNFRRRQNSSVASAIGEFVVGALAGGATALAAIRSPWMLLPLVLSLGLLWIYSFGKKPSPT